MKTCSFLRPRFCWPREPFWHRRNLLAGRRSETHSARRRPKASMPPPSTRPPTPAPTSTSTPAATGSRTTPSPPTRCAGAASTCSPSATATCLWQELEAASTSPKTPLQKKYGDYYAACMNTALIDQKGTRAAQAGARPHRLALSDPKQISSGPRRACKAGRSPAPCSASACSRTRRTRPNRSPASSRAASPCLTATTTSSTTSASTPSASSTAITWSKMFTLAGDSPDQAAKEADAVIAIETALAKVSTAARRPARPREALPHLHRRGLPEAHAGLRLQRLLQGHLNVATSKPSTSPRPTSSRA